MNISEIDSSPLPRYRKELSISTEQFRQYVIDRIDSDEVKRDELRDQLFVISDNIQSLTVNVDSMSKALIENTIMTKRTASELEENTFLTKQTAILATKTAADTAGLVGLSKLTEATASAVTNGTKKVSKFSKIMTPIIVLLGLIGALWNGGLHWNDILKALK